MTTSIDIEDCVNTSTASRSVSTFHSPLIETRIDHSNNDDGERIGISTTTTKGSGTIGY